MAREYREGAHTVYDIKMHLVWVTKYRHKVLRGEVGTRTRDLVRQVCAARELKILKGHVGVDHVHLLVSMPPSLSVSQMMQYLKGKSSRVMLPRVRGTAASLLGPAPVGPRVLLRLVGHGDRRDDQGVHRPTGRAAGRRVPGGRREALAGVQPRHPASAATVGFQPLDEPTGFSR
jgi:REP element-mobilizing transposase RayT